MNRKCPNGSIALPGSPGGWPRSTRRLSGDRSGERGAGLVELALSLPILIVLLLGTITSALALNDDIQLTHAAREGARHGATVPADEVFGSGNWATNMRNVVVERFGDGLATGDVCVALVDSSPPSPLSTDHTTRGDGRACYDDSASGLVDARVQVTATRASSIDTGLYSFDLTLESEAAARHESNG